MPTIDLTDADVFNLLGILQAQIIRCRNKRLTNTRAVLEELYDKIENKPTQAAAD